MIDAWEGFVQRAESLDERVGPILRKCSLERDDEHDDWASEVYLGFPGGVVETTYTIVAPSVEVFEALKSIGPILRAVANQLPMDVLQIESPTGEILVARLDPPDKDELLSVLNRLDRILSETIPDVVGYFNAIGVLDVPTRDVDGFLLNPIEEVFYQLLKESNLLFSPQCQIVHQGRIVNRFDFLVIYNGRAYRVEIDGYDAHTTKEAHVKDRVSDRFYEQRGIPVIRFAASEVYKDADACWRELVDVLTGEKGTDI